MQINSSNRNNNVSFKSYLTFVHEGTGVDGKRFIEHFPTTYLDNDVIEAGLTSLIKAMESTSTLNLSLWEVKGSKAKIKETEPDASISIHNGLVNWTYRRTEGKSSYIADDYRFFELDNLQNIHNVDPNFAPRISNKLVKGLKDDRKALKRAIEEQGDKEPMLKTYDLIETAPVSFETYSGIDVNKIMQDKKDKEAKRPINLIKKPINAVLSLFKRN